MRIARDFLKIGLATSIAMGALYGYRTMIGVTWWLTGASALLGIIVLAMVSTRLFVGRQASRQRRTVNAEVLEWTLLYTRLRTVEKPSERADTVRSLISSGRRAGFFVTVRSVPHLPGRQNQIRFRESSIPYDELRHRTLQRARSYGNQVAS
jgi:hypothetical protein